MTNLLFRISDGSFSPVAVVENPDAPNPRKHVSGSVEWVFYGIACEKGDIPPLMKYVVKDDTGKTFFQGEFSVWGSVAWMWELLQIDQDKRRLAEGHFVLAISPIYHERNKDRFLVLEDFVPEKDGDSYIFNQWGVSGNGNNTDKHDLTAEDAGNDNYGGLEAIDVQYRMTAEPKKDQSSGTFS